jgi:hypothetical protein
MSGLEAPDESGPPVLSDAAMASVPLPVAPGVTIRQTSARAGRDRSGHPAETILVGRPSQVLRTVD